MKKTAMIMSIIAMVSLGTINIQAEESESQSLTDISPYQKEPGYREELIFPNGNMVYFQRVDDSGNDIDTSGYVSGVYDNSVPRKLLYEIDYTFGDVGAGKSYIFSSTATHHVEYQYIDGSVFISNLNKPVLKFYEYGQLKKEHTLANLIQDSDKIIGTSNGLLWIESSNYDIINGILEIQTKDNLYYAFDIYTGKILYSSSTDPLLQKTISIGSEVVITGSHYYYESSENDLYDNAMPIPIWVKCMSHTVTKIDGNKVLLGGKNGINSWVYKDSLIIYDPDILQK